MRCQEELDTGRRFLGRCAAATDTDRLNESLKAMSWNRNADYSFAVCQNFQQVSVTFGIKYRECTLDRPTQH